MRNLREILEGLFDDNIGNKAAEVAVEKWLEKNAVGTFKIKTDNQGKMTIKGDIKFIGVKKFEPLNIVKVDGSIYFENCPDLKNFQNIFYDVARIEGTLGVINCPNFDSLMGAPEWTKSVDLSKLPKLKSLEGLPRWAERVTITQCGKRFTKEQIQKQTSTTTRVFCSEENEIPNILEAFSDPLLSKFVEKLNRLQKDKKWGKVDFKRYLPHDWKLSEINASAREEFDVLTDPEKKWITIAQKIVRRGQYQIDGIMIGTKDEEITFFFASTGYANQWVHFSEDGTVEYNSVEPNMVSSFFSKNNLIGRMDVDTLYIYTTRLSQKDENGYIRTSFTGRNDQQIARRAAQDGVIYMDKDHLERYVRENRERYKKLAAKLRTERGANKYVKYGEIAEKMMDRFAKVLKKAFADPNWADKYSYEIGKLRASLCATKRWNSSTGRGSSGYYTEGGVLERIQALLDKQSDIRKGYGSESSLASIENDIKKAIDNAERYFSTLGF